MLRHLTQQRNRYGDARASVDLDLSIREELPIVEYSGGLNGDWVSLSNALTEQQDAKFQGVTIPKVDIDYNVMGMLARKLKGRIQRSLVLSNNNIENGDEIESLSALIRGNPAMTHLRISDNPIGTCCIASSGKLFRAINVQPNLECLCLAGCSIGDNEQSLSLILQSDAKFIRLNDNGIGSIGAAVIANNIEVNPTKQQLDLDKNELGDDDASLLSQALATNTNLQSISAHGNKFTFHGVKTLFKAIFDSSSMNTISDSNHACQLSLFSARDPYFNEIEGINAKYIDDENIRQSKINTALLHSRESLLHYIKGVELEMMPYVIELVQSSEVHRRLLYHMTPYWILVLVFDMMYTIMRYLDMPSLYNCKSNACKKS